MSMEKFVNELNGDRVEGELLKTFLISLVTSVLIVGILYFTSLKNVEGFIPRYGFFIFFSILSYAFIVPTIRQVRAYKEFACMSGMMIGMTMGMIAGFLPGFYIASTNGMFYGSVIGMLVGISLGVWMGKCCGIMGIMEGMMAGFMGGLMGGMTSIMLLNDNLKYMTIIIFAITSFIMFGLNYMIYSEMKENERQKNEDYTVVIGLSFILTALTVWFIVYGPRSAFFGG